MATGIIGVLSGTGAISYTPQSPAKVNLTYYTSSGNMLINGVTLGNNVGNVSLWVGANQTANFSLSGSGNMVISALEA